MNWREFFMELVHNKSDSMMDDYSCRLILSTIPGLNHFFLHNVLLDKSVSLVQDPQVQQHKYEEHHGRASDKDIVNSTAKN